jgi:hypothetical protein
MRRIRAALNFRTPRHQRFDGFALDIESTAVRSIATRNRRLMRLSRRLRRVVGPNRALGAIIPDPAGQRYWTRFPYRGVARHFDIFLPMGYWTYRVRGYRNVYRFTRKNINIIRTATGRPHEPVHLIGGLADVAGNTEVKAFVTASRDFGALGASLYDYPITRRAEWRILRTVR